MSGKLVRRLALVGLLFPFCYFGAASATFLFRIHAQNDANSRVPLSSFPAPSPSQRIVVFSPHPDDEALGCAGMLQQAVKSGASVRVVYLTNGDGFRVAVEREYREMRLQPADYIRFAGVRQDEVRRAMQDLGVPVGDLTFLGYPDRGLMPMWESHWTSDDRYQSPYTRTSACPYPVAYHPGATYCGQTLLGDLESVLRGAQPTDVYVTHPSDDHPDHAAAAAFVTLALEELREEGQPWARECREHYYLVHRGDWPFPQGLYRGDPLSPPAEIAALDTRWRSRRLSRAETDRKAKAIQEYASQTAVMKRFLLSFARRNELFGELQGARVPEVPPGRAPQGDLVRWVGVPPAVEDPVNDNLMRDFQPGADIRFVYACRDATTLYLRIESLRPISPRVQLTVRLRYFGDSASGDAGGTYTAVVRPPTVVSPAGLPASSRNGNVQIGIPLRDIGYAHRFALGVESRVAGILVDRTGYRYLRD